MNRKSTLLITVLIVLASVTTWFVVIPMLTPDTTTTTTMTITTTGPSVVPSLVGPEDVTLPYDPDATYLLRWEWYCEDAHEWSLTGNGLQIAGGPRYASDDGHRWFNYYVPQNGPKDQTFVFTLTIGDDVFLDTVHVIVEGP